jgi:phosphopantothenoylcysteine synthetase/decarboxylase
LPNLTASEHEVIDHNARTVHLVVCAAPPVQHLPELLSALIDNGWTVQITATVTASTWIDMGLIGNLIGEPVRATQRHPSEPKSAGSPAIVVAVPATFNTINKWAAGINDSAALAVLQSALGEGTPVLVYPYAKATLTSHPAYGMSVQVLKECGAQFASLSQEDPSGTGHHFAWTEVVTAMTAAMATRQVH